MQWPFLNSHKHNQYDCRSTILRNYYIILLIQQYFFMCFFFFSSRRRHTRLQGDWSSDVCSSDLIYTTVALVPTAIFILVQREYFVAPADWATVSWFALSIVMTALLQFFTSYAMALLAFWVLEVSTFIFILFAFEYIAGGHLFPLDILPPAISHALFFTPFPYQLYFPVSIY